MRVTNVKQYKGKFFEVLQETPLTQIGVMTIRSKQDAGSEETHGGDQIIYILEGEADVKIANEKVHLTEGMIVTIPAETRHHVYNPGLSDLFFLTIYSPPQY